MSLSLQEQYDKIYRYCYFHVKNTHLAEDLTQETFLKFFGQRSYINRGKPLAYLYTIARNLCTDEYRKETTISLTETEEICSEDTDTGIAVRQAIDRLDEVQREIIMLRYSNDLAISEICEITGLSRFAVRRRITSAIKSLKKMMRKEDFS